MPNKYIKDKLCLPIIQILFILGLFISIVVFIYITLFNEAKAALPTPSSPVETVKNICGMFNDSYSVTVLAYTNDNNNTALTNYTVCFNSKADADNYYNSFFPVTKLNVSKTEFIKLIPVRNYLVVKGFLIPISN